MKEHDIENMFAYHPAEGEQPGIYGAMRFMCLQLAKFIMNAVPPCGEREEAIKKLNEVMFWANSGVARCQEDAEKAIQKANEVRQMVAETEKSGKKSNV